MHVYLNGDYTDAASARISPFDRGFLFGDGVYEGLRAHNGAIVGLARHTARLHASLDEAAIGGFDAGQMGAIAMGLVERTGSPDAFVYFQVTRGTPGEEQPWRERLPDDAIRPTVFAYAEALPPLREMREPKRVRLALRPDTRWTRCHVKSTSLMGNVMAALEARDAGADDAVFVRDGIVAEGTSTNVFIAKGDAIATPALTSSPMLEGVTRRLILDAVPLIEERAISVEELLGADEVMLVGTRTVVASASAIDGRAMAGGDTPGPQARKLLDALLGAIARDVDSAHVIH
jgi:D-alanine transaminase